MFRGTPVADFSSLSSSWRATRVARWMLVAREEGFFHVLQIEEEGVLVSDGFAVVVLVVVIGGAELFK